MLGTLLRRRSCIGGPVNGCWQVPLHPARSLSYYQYSRKFNQENSKANGRKLVGASIPTLTFKRSCFHPGVSGVFYHDILSFNGCQRTFERRGRSKSRKRSYWKRYFQGGNRSCLLKFNHWSFGFNPYQAMVSYVWPKDDPSIKKRVIASLALLVSAKVINTSVPFIFRYFGRYWMAL